MFGGTLQEEVRGECSVLTVIQKSKSVQIIRSRIRELRAVRIQYQKSNPQSSVRVENTVQAASKNQSRYPETGPNTDKPEDQVRSDQVQEN